MIFAGRTTTVSAEDERDRGPWMFVDSQDNQGPLQAACKACTVM